MSSDVIFTYPMRPWEDTKIDTIYLDPEYRKEWGNWHTGWDLNLKSGGDTDLGYPVQACVPGKVIEAYQHPSWGGLVLLKAEDWVTDLVRSRFPDKRVETLEFQYGHLHQITVRRGDQVDPGDHLGSIGKGGQGQYLAHLHWDIRLKHYPASYWPGGTTAAMLSILGDYLDPEVLMHEFLWNDFGRIASHRKQYVLSRYSELGEQVLEGERKLALRRVERKLYVREVDHLRQEDSIK